MSIFNGLPEEGEYIKPLTNRKAINNRWKELGFLDGLKGHLKENIAQLYESEASQLLKKEDVPIVKAQMNDGFGKKKAND
jgi:hypothetical protein